MDSEKETILAKINYHLLIPVFTLCAFLAARDGMGMEHTRFWESLNQKVERLVVNQNTHITASPASAQKDALYWKGEEQVRLVSDAERALFQAGLELVKEKKRQQAMDFFNRFIEAYPESKLLGDAQKAVEILRIELRPREQGG